MNETLIYFFTAINVVTFLTFGYDKYLAKNNKWRIPERSLFLLTLMCGSIGAVLGMFLFKHKISKPSFYIPIIIIIALQIAIVYFFGWENLIDVLI